MKKCNVCGRRFRLLAKNRYEVAKIPVGLNCLTQGKVYYNAFDCPHCGCQNIVGVFEDEKYVKVADNVGAVLNKIRDEIEQKCCITVGRENEPAITLYDVFQIIDKYRAESEV